MTARAPMLVSPSGEPFEGVLPNDVPLWDPATRTWLAGQLPSQFVDKWLRWGAAANNSISPALIFMRQNASGTASTAEATSTYLIPVAGNVVGLIGRNQIATAADVTFTLRVNGVDTPLALTLPGASTALLSTALAVPVAPGDLVSLRADAGGATINAFNLVNGLFLPS